MNRIRGAGVHLKRIFFNQTKYEKILVLIYDNIQYLIILKIFLGLNSMDYKQEKMKLTVVELEIKQLIDKM